MYASGHRHFPSYWTSVVYRKMKVKLFCITILHTLYPKPLFSQNSSSKNTVELPLIDNPVYRTSRTTPFRFQISKFPAVQYFTSPSQPSLPSFCSLFFKELMVSPRKRRRCTHEELPHASQPKSLPLGPTLSLSQLPPAHKEVKLGAMDGSSHLRTAPRLPSRHVTCPRLFDASSPYLSGSLDPSPHQNAILPTSLQPL